MSLLEEGRLIRCDGDGCRATARPLVALRSTLHTQGTAPEDDLAGWLFLSSGGLLRQFCPLCGQRYLAALSDPASADDFCPTPASPATEERSSVL